MFKDYIFVILVDVTNILICVYDSIFLLKAKEPHANCHEDVNSCTNMVLFVKAFYHQVKTTEFSWVNKLTKALSSPNRIHYYFKSIIKSI